MILGGHFDFDSKQKLFISLNQKMNDVNFWDDKEEANLILTRIRDLRNVIDPVLELDKSISNNLEVLKDLDIEKDNELFELIQEEYNTNKEKLDELELQTYLSGEYDKNNCIFEIHSGAGGTEACDWANMLYRMYVRYLLKKGYKIEEIDKQSGDEVGIKSVMFKVIGFNAYGYLKGEKGVHRLVRISPFDANKRRHTSFASVEIIPEIEKNVDIVILDKDLKVDIYRSSGPGGQGVNTTDSAVRITHLPTGIVVTCQNERSQIQNKEHCLEILKSKLYALELEHQQQELNDMKQGQKSIAFGSGKRSYVMCPYTLVKDVESGYETSNVLNVLDGELDGFINAGLRK